MNVPRSSDARVLAAAALALASLTVSGCSDSSPAPEVSLMPAESTSAAPTGPAPTGGTTTPGPSGSTTLDNRSLLTRAAALTLSKSPRSTLISIDLQSTEANGSIWQVTLVTRTGDEQDVELTADGRKITRGPVTDQQSASDRSANLALVKAASLTYADAVDKLPSSVKGGRITQLDLDTEAGRVVWAANTTDVQQLRHDIHIDAASGKVLLDQT